MVWGEKPKIGHKMAVEDIVVDEIEASRFQPGNLIGQTAVIAIEEGRSQT